MSDKTNLDVIAQGIDMLYATGKINAAVKADVEAFVAKIPEYKTRRFGYSDFDQLTAINCIFDDALQVVEGDNDFEVRSKAISLTDVQLVAVKLMSSDPIDDVLWISTDGGTTFYIIPDDRIFLTQTAQSFILKFTSTSASNITGFYLIYL